jgi:hypothetical protein
MLDHMACLFLVFLRILHMFSIVVVLAYVTKTVYEGCFSPPSWPTFVVICILDGSYSSRSKVES